MFSLRRFPKPKVAGSNPAGRIFFVCKRKSCYTYGQFLKQQKCPKSISCPKLSNHVQGGRVKSWRKDIRVCKFLANNGSGFVKSGNDGTAMKKLVSLQLSGSMV